MSTTDPVSPPADPISPHAREILVLRRASGYVRFQIPPLLYVRSLGLKLEQSLQAMKGVRRVRVDPTRVRLSVFYDPWIATDRPILLEVDRLATPLLLKMDPEKFELALREQRRARLGRLGGKAVQGAYLGALVVVHAYMLRAWVLHPVRYWWVWGLIGFGVYTHRRQIRSIPQLS